MSAHRIPFYHSSRQHVRLGTGRRLSAFSDGRCPFRKDRQLGAWFSWQVTSWPGRESLGRDYVTLSSRFAVVLAMIGVLHYFTPLSVPVYERILRGGALPEGYIDAGLGFMGLFRGATGQLMTSVALLSLAGTGRTWHGVALPIVAGINVLMSGSRAGLLGFALGVVTYVGALLFRARSGRPEDGLPAFWPPGVDWRS